MKHSLPHVLTLLLQAAVTLSTPIADHKPHSSGHATFTLHNITYYDSTIYSTPAHLAVADASIQFNLTNTVVSYTTECSAYVGYWGWPGFFYGDQIYSCKVPGSVDPGASTNFTFSRGGNFEVNSTWSCGSGDEKETYLGVGNGAVKLACNSTHWTNANWTLGQLYSTYDTNCTPAHLDISPTVSYSKPKGYSR